jgi:fibronectin type 3 domain-containing protein
MNSYRAVSVGSASSNERFRRRFTSAGRRFRHLIAVVAIAASLGFSGCSSMSSASNLAAVSGLNANPAQSNGANPAQSNVASAHDVTLNWNASISSGVVGYNVYRRNASGGPYSKVNSSSVTVTTYNDNAVQPGQTYFYVVTSIDLSDVESSYSNEVMAPIP